MVLDEDHPVPRKSERDQFANTLCLSFLAQVVQQSHRLRDSRPEAPDFPTKSDIQVIDVPIFIHELIPGHGISRVITIEGYPVDLANTQSALLQNPLNGLGRQARPVLAPA